MSRQHWEQRLTPRQRYQDAPPSYCRDEAEVTLDLYGDPIELELACLVEYEAAEPRSWDSPGYPGFYYVADVWAYREHHGWKRLELPDWAEERVLRACGYGPDRGAEEAYERRHAWRD